jgi:2-polyprenyl-3-methyl-5-hydroxy-6-metoxy-1,4-benzoquinol methylase
MKDARLRRHALGFWELANKPNPQELAAYYEKNYFQNETANYRKSYSALEAEVIDLRIALRAAHVAALTGRTSPGSMLDVGCGEGFVIRHFSSMGWQVAGIDFSRAGVEQINPEYAHLVEQGDVFRLLEAKIAAAEKHDLVWLGNVLEHVLDPVDLLQSLRELVSPGGLLVVTVPNDGSAYQETLLDSGVIPERFWIAVPDHISYFTADNLRHTTAATGWQCLAIQGDFPIDLFLAHPGSNYVSDRSLGPAAHQARLQLEQLIGQAGLDPANRFYTALANVGLGRNLTAYLRPQTEAFSV